MSRSFLALWLPYLAIERLIRDGVAPGDAALATVERQANAMRLAQLGERALQIGLTPGMTLANARALLPELIVHDDAPGEDRALLEWLADGCDRFTPMVALYGRDGLMLDLTGCAPADDVCAEMILRLNRLSLSARGGQGKTPEMAMARARYAIDAVCALPVAALDIGDETHVALQRAGLKTVGAVAKRPRAALATRFGADLVTRLLRLTGEADSRIVPRRVPPPVFAIRRFAEPVARMDDILAALRDLMRDCCAELERRGEGARILRATLFRSDGDVRALPVETGRAVRDPAAIAKLFDERIDALADPLDPGFGFDALRLDVEVSEPLANTSPEFLGKREEDEPATALIDRLSTRLGPSRVTRLVPADTHIPEQAQLALPAIAPPQPAAFAPASFGTTRRDEPPLRPLHLFDPPQPVEVVTVDPSGPPHEFRWRRRLHPVVRVEGPERIAAEWWTRLGGEQPGHGGLTRDYYRVEDVRGRRFWLFRHGLAGVEKAQPRWFLHGLFA